MSLSTYKQKRNFKKTPEPSGGKASAKAHALHYVIQKHDASHLHYDFRLELDGVLKSWAVPKGPSVDPARKALAVQVEDHPLDYETFEGVIPKGQYGGGTVMVWDRGTWEPAGDPREGLARGKLHFELHGEKLRREWSLVQMHGDRNSNGRNWLLMKIRDAHAGTRDILKEQPQSVKSDRSLEEIADQRDDVWDSKKGRATTDEGESAAMPRSIVPQLATLADHPPIGDGWIHEIKFDGYRLIAYIKDGTVTLRTRKDLDWTARFMPLVKPLEKLKADTAIVDGEAVVLNAKGQSDFQALQAMFKGKEKVDLHYFAFDLLFLNGRDLRALPLLKRKEMLKALLDKSGSPIDYSDHVRGDGTDVIRKACALGSEGIVSKRVDAAYVSRRDASWLKSKCGRRQEFVIVGFTRSDKRRNDLRSLLLGVYDAENGLVYSGRVGTGFDTKLRKELFAQLSKLEQEKTPTDIPPPPREQRAAHWVKPTLVCEVQFEHWTRDGVLRHPSFIALRQDKPAREVTRELPVPVSDDEPQAADETAPESEDGHRNGNGSHRHSNGKVHATARKAPAKTAASKRTAAARKPADDAAEPSKNPTTATGEPWAGVRMTHPDKIIYPDLHLRKRDLADYYAIAAPFMLPHVVERPLSLMRCPAGMAAKCFFMRNWSNTLPNEIDKIAIGGGESHVMIHDAGGLFAMAQISALEVHTWNCHVTDIEHPDQLVFDLDPGPGMPWKDMVRGAQLLRELLESIGIKPFLKTSGGKGLHLTIPIKPNVGWSEAKAFCKTLADHMAAQNDLFVSNMRKDLRKEKIYVDYLRNERTATAVAPYSSRARVEAGVSMPLAWDQLADISKADHFTLKNAGAFLAKRRKDPWAGFADAVVDLHKIARHASINKE